MPIIRYCSEIWAPYSLINVKEENIYELCDKNGIESVNLKVCKFVLGVKRNAANAAVRGELGLYPVAIDMLSHSIKYFLRVTSQTPTNSLVYKAYRQSVTLNNEGYKSWATGIKHALIMCKGKQYLG